MHFMMIFSVQIIALIAAIFLKLYVQKNDFSKLYSIGSKVLLVLVHLMLAATIVHTVLHCNQGHCAKKCHATEMKRGGDKCGSKKDCDSKKACGSEKACASKKECGSDKACGSKKECGSEKACGSGSDCGSGKDYGKGHAEKGGHCKK